MEPHRSDRRQGNFSAPHFIGIPALGAIQPWKGYAIVNLRITTWNVNSVRKRLDGVKALVEARNPDILCLQETKVANADFPLDALTRIGYGHSIFNGGKGQSGVAILSRRHFVDSGTRDWCDREDGRHVYANLADGIEINNFYVPAGGDEPDPDINDKFAHKLQFLAELTNWFAARKSPLNKFVMVGDLNVAPLPTDVWSHQQLFKVVSHTPVEVAALDRLRAAHDWVDALRHFFPPDEKLYSWWSYRARDWRAADRGRRLDHIWVTPALGPALQDAEIMSEARGWPVPSDHVPVTVNLRL